MTEGFNLLGLAKFSSPFFIYLSLMIILRIGIEKAPFLKNPSIKPITDIGKTVLHILIIGITLLATLGTFGIDVGGIFEGVGLVSFAIGLMFKDVVSSFITGMSIIINKPFSIGDELIIDGVRGHVIKMDMRYVTLDNEKERHIIPNSLLGTFKITIVKTENFRIKN